MKKLDERGENAIHAVSDMFTQFIRELAEDDRLSELEGYIPKGKVCQNWNINKAKIVLELLKSRNSDELEKILDYLDHPGYGWQEGKYYLYNSCLRYDHHCKRMYYVVNEAVDIEGAFSDIEEIFLHRKYGSITTYLFGYCLAALFSSRLRANKLSVPYFLQIACEKNSNVYRLIHEIVNICDVNAGINKNCDVILGYGYCELEHVTIFPEQSSNILYYRDIPIIVEGYESEKLYSDLLRKTANIPGSSMKLGKKDRMNMLPIFICPSIKSSFKNVFNMELTSLDIDEDYMELVEKNRQRLASWVFELVMDAGMYIKQRNEDMVKERYKGGKESPLFWGISERIDGLRTNYSRYAGLTLTDVTNIGYLTYFLTKFMEVFNISIRSSIDTKFVYRGILEKHDKSKLIAGILTEVTDELFELHNNFSPVVQKRVNINVPSHDSEEKKIQKKGGKFAKDIIKYYQSYGVLINILPKAEYRNDRYVFEIRLLPGTDGKLICKYADEIRRLLGIEFFLPDITPSSIKLIASEKPLKENSLLRILESYEFKESKLEIPYAVGYDLMGGMVIADVAEFPHLLIGGTTNSGKSSAIHSLLLSIVCKQPANKVKLLLFDFGASKLKLFKDVPHMLMPGKIIDNITEGRQCILKLQNIMEQRLEMLNKLDQRSYDKKLKKLPSIVCVIDEFPAFIRQLTDGKGNKKSSEILEDLLARARKVKIHLVLAAQDATQNGIGIKRTNLAAGIAFRCTSWHNSSAIIGEPDAVNLSGKGSLYFRCDQYEGIRRLQGAYMPPDEIMNMLDNMKFSVDNVQYDEVNFKMDFMQKTGYLERQETSFSCKDTDEKRLLEIVRWIWDEKKENISNKQLKDKLEIGYDTANKFLQMLENAKIVSPKKAKTPRKVNQDEVKKLLENNGYIEDSKEVNLDNTINGSNKPIHGASMKEQIIENSNETNGIQMSKDSKVHDRVVLDRKKLDDELGSLKKTRYRKKR